MSLIRYEPVSLFDQFNHELNRFFTRTRPTTAGGETRDWAPAVDIREEDDRFLLIADIPGVKRDDVEVTLEDGVLTIKGERRTETEENREVEYALPVHPVVAIPKLLNGFAFWNVVILVYIVASYGYPIAQFFILETHGTIPWGV